ncbi:MAG TPA: hypothetical protein VGC47_08280 [Acidimicrobiia bacterium]|jgi:hypothetical protein
MPARRIRRRSLAAIAAALAAVLVAPATGAATSAKPIAAYIANNGSIVVASTAGAGERLPPLATFSIDSGVVVGVGASGLEAYDAKTGDELWDGVPNVHQPIVTDSGRRVLFWPDPGGVRDPQVNSLWMRGRNEKVRKVVQFSNGPGLPGYDSGFDGDGGLLSTSIDNSGNTIVLGQGNDVDLFIYDVFAVDRATKQVTRLTSGKESRWPSISPNGELVVYQRDEEVCAGLAYVRAAKLMVVKPNATQRHLLAAGTCDAWYSNARWINNHEIVVYKTTYDGADFKTRIFKIDVLTGHKEKLVNASDIVFFSAARGRVGYVRDSKAGWYLLDVDSGTKIHFKGFIPHLAGDHNTI